MMMMHIVSICIDLSINLSYLSIFLYPSIYLIYLFLSIHHLSIYLPIYLLSIYYLSLSYIHTNPSTGQIAKVGTLCKVTDRQLLDDGRQFIALEG